MFLRALRTVERTCLVTVLNAVCIECATNDVVAHTGEVSYSATPDKNNRVLLQVVSDTGDISCTLEAVCQTDTSNFSKCRVRLLGGHGAYTCADSATLGTLLEDRGG